MSKVALVRCESYNYDEVKKAIDKGLELLGGVEKFCSPNEKLLLKPNLLATDTSTKCATTNPEVFKAVATAFKGQCASLTYGDSPAFQSPKSVSRKNGIGAYAESLGIELSDFESGSEITFPEGIQNKKFTIANGILQKDCLISICKMKTHGFMKVTGAIKNQFGAIPGTLKGEFHVKVPDSNTFAKMLIDLNRYLKPRLYIMDGIVAMEGNGPRSGDAKQMNVLLFSTDPVALDATFCRIINLDPTYVPTNVYGKEFGLGTYLENEIELVGDPLQSFVSKDFNVKRTPLTPHKSENIAKNLRSIIGKKPIINQNKCVKCGICVKMCPLTPKALNWVGKEGENIPQYDYTRCIRCFCCQELCPEGAITIKQSFLGQLFFRSRKK